MGPNMSEYVLGHHLKGEGSRLALMSEVLDPMHRRYIEALEIIKPGARALEVGCGNGMDGSRGRANGGSITTSGASWRRGSQRWA